MDKKEFTILFGKGFDKDFEGLSEDDKKAVLDKIVLLKDDPYYKSLRTKKIKGYYFSSASMDIRVVWQFSGTQNIVLLYVGHHDIIKKLKKNKKSKK